MASTQQFISTDENFQKMLRNLESQTGRAGIDLKKLEKEFTKSVFVNQKFIPVQEDAVDTMFRLVRTGYYAINSSEQLYISIIKLKGQYGNIFVGTLRSLTKRAIQKGHHAYTTSEKRELYDFLHKEGIQNTEEFESAINCNVETVASNDKVVTGKPLVNTNYVSQQLSDDIYMPKPVAGVSSLRWINYALCTASDRARSMVKTENRGVGYAVYDKSMLVVNTGLLDRMLNPVLITTTIAPCDAAHMVRVVETTAELIEFGLPQDAIQGVLRFDGFYGEMDKPCFDNYFAYSFNPTGLMHTVITRRSRFGAQYKDLPDETLCSLLTGAIERAIKIGKYNSSYINPAYSCTDDAVIYLIPLHLLKGISEEPELFALVTRESGVWVLKTVLPVEDSLIRIKGFAPYHETIFDRYSVNN